MACWVRRPRKARCHSAFRRMRSTCCSHGSFPRPDRARHGDDPLFPCRGRQRFLPLTGASPSDRGTEGSPASDGGYSPQGAPLPSRLLLACLAIPRVALDGHGFRRHRLPGKSKGGERVDDEFRREPEAAGPERGLERECALYRQAALCPDKEAWYADQLTRLYRHDFEAAIREGNERALNVAGFKLERVAKTVRFFREEG